ncbi:retrovirus-related pol polyprotein from transposon TNT 1-94 [Tanacetum coccineum]|uniref:Retrovirus-related pol polyprotein from transposon TNT 1-94 n=1 Tax=Tanacetum coccineum TaxID=301880 RepID=A0ABQ5HJS0_9ASTR
MMANLSEDIQCAGSDTRPPILDRSDFESWQQRIRLYYLGKDNGENIFKSLDEGSFKMGKFRETFVEGAEGALHLGPERDRVFANLKPEEKKRFKADIHATNILLQGLPKDIHTLINHYTNAKDIWDNVKMLLKGYELMKDEHKSQLYDEFEHFRKNKGETIHEYYLRFTKLINDMRNIKITMPKMQLNSKFVNNMFPEWGRFMTAVKLNRGLKTSNYDQLYAYLKQHEAHANENKMMLERYNQHAIDPLTFISNVSPPHYTKQSLAILQSAYVPPVTHQPQFTDNTQLDLGLTPTDDLIENLTKNSCPTRPGRQNRGQGNYVKGAVVAINEGAQNRVGNTNTGQAKQIQCYNCYEVGHIARQCTHPKRKQNSEYFKDKMLLMQAQENGVVLDEEQLLFIAGGQTNTFDDDVDEAPTMFMANLSSVDPIYDEAGPSYDSDILYESVMNDVNTVSRFFELHDAYTIAQSRCLELEAEISKLKHKIEKDDHSKMIKRFSNLEIDHLNFQLKYQNLKERFGNNKSQTVQDAPEFDSLFKVNKMKASLQEKDNAIRKLKEKISQMNEGCSEADSTLDFKALDSQNIELTEHVTALQEQNERFRAENKKVK